MDQAKSQIEQDASGEAAIDQLLGGEVATTEPAAAAVETEEPAATEETVDTDTESNEPADETTEEVDESAEAAEEESEELSITESDREFSDDFYARAAAKFSKNLKVQYDPNDPKDRATLRELVSRGEDFKALKAAQTQADDEKAKGEEKQPEQVAERRTHTPQEIQANIKNVQEFVKPRVVPEVALHVANRFVKALWPNEKAEIPQEQAMEITAALMEFGVFALQDMQPMIQQQTLAELQAHPVYGRMASSAVNEGALEALDTQKDASGNPKYPDLVAMAERGEIAKAFQANPWIKESNFGERDPIKAQAKRIETAYKLARGEKINPAAMSRAVATGKKSVVDASKRAAAARVAPGKSKGELAGGQSAGEKLVSELTSNSGGAFSRAIAASKK